MTAPVAQALPTYADVCAAAARIEGHVHRTPVLTSRRLNDEVGAEVFIKCENLQRAGAFKIRGAYNALAQFSDVQRRAGVICFSSGNHAQGVALAAQMLGIPATIVMPQDAPAIKVEATRGYGGKVVFFDRYTQDREQICRSLAEADGLTLIPPFDHPHVIAGQGTAIKELLEETGPLDVLFIGVGGGGVLSGSALAARALAPQCAIYGVEPETANDAQQSMAAGRIISIPTPQTIADGVQTQHVGQIPFAIMQRDVNGIVTVTDPQLVEGMRFFASSMKIIVEPTGALGLAAVRHLKHDLRGKRVGTLITGGNVDLARFSSLLA